MPDVDEELQELYRLGREKGYVEKNPELRDLLALGVKRGYLRDLSQPAKAATFPRSPSRDSDPETSPGTRSGAQASPRSFMGDDGEFRPDFLTPRQMVEQNAPTLRKVGRVAAVATGTAQDAANALQWRMQHIPGQNTAANRKALDDLNAVIREGDDEMMAAARAAGGARESTVASLTGFAAGARLGGRVPGPPLVKGLAGFGGGMIGAAAAAYGAGKAKEGIDTAIQGRGAVRDYQQQLAREAKRYPVETSIAANLPSLVFAKMSAAEIRALPGLLAAIRAGKGTGARAAIKTLASSEGGRQVLAALGSRTMEAGAEVAGGVGEGLVTGKPIDWQKVGIDAAFGALTPDETRLGKGLVGAGEGIAEGVMRRLTRPVGKVTNYGTKDDRTPDSNSARGIGSFPHSSKPGSLIPGVSVAVKNSDFGRELRRDGIKPGDYFVVEFNNGQTKKFKWDDTIPEHGSGSMDVYNPNGRESNFSLNDARIVALGKASGASNPAMGGQSIPVPPQFRGAQGRRGGAPLVIGAQGAPQAPQSAPSLTPEQQAALMAPGQAEMEQATGTPPPTFDPATLTPEREAAQARLLEMMDLAQQVEQGGQPGAVQAPVEATGQVPQQAAEVPPVPVAAPPALKLSAPKDSPPTRQKAAEVLATHLTEQGQIDSNGHGERPKNWTPEEAIQWARRQAMGALDDNDPYLAWPNPDTPPDPRFESSGYQPTDFDYSDKEQTRLARAVLGPAQYDAIQSRVVTSIATDSNTGERVGYNAKGGEVFRERVASAQPPTPAKENAETFTRPDQPVKETGKALQVTAPQTATPPTGKAEGAPDTRNPVYAIPKSTTPAPAKSGKAVQSGNGQNATKTASGAENSATVPGGGTPARPSSARGGNTPGTNGTTPANDGTPAPGSNKENRRDAGTSSANENATRNAGAGATVPPGVGSTGTNGPDAPAASSHPALKRLTHSGQAELMASLGLQSHRETQDGPAGQSEAALMQSVRDNFDALAESVRGRLASKTPGVATAEEQRVADALQQYAKEQRNALQKKVTDGHALTPEEEGQYALHLKEIADLNKLLDTSGSAQGSDFRARKGLTERTPFESIAADAEIRLGDAMSPQLRRLLSETEKAGRQAEDLAQAKREAAGKKADEHYKARRRTTTERTAPASKAGESGNPAAKEYGTTNKVFTKDKYEAAKANLSKIKVTPGAGSFGAPLSGTSTIFRDLVDIGGFHFEAGLRKFGDWAAQMRQDTDPNLTDRELAMVWNATVSKSRRFLTEAEVQDAAQSRLDHLKDIAGATTTKRTKQPNPLLDIAVEEFAKRAQTAEQWAKAVEKRTGLSLSLETRQRLYEQAGGLFAAQNVPVDQVKRRMSALVEKEVLATRSKPEQAVHALVETSGATRSIITSFDYSGWLNQGGILATARPRLSVGSEGALAQMFKAGSSEENFQRINGALLARQTSRYGSGTFYKDAGLELSEVGDDADLTKREEGFAKGFVEKIPGIRGSERSYATVLNVLRADTFDAMYEPGMSIDEAKDIARYINVATGRGDVNAKFKDTAAAAAHVIFSPRYLVSRVQYLIGQPFWRASSSRTKKLIAKEYARYLYKIAAFVALGTASGLMKWDFPEEDVRGKKLNPVQRFIYGMTSADSGNLRIALPGTGGGELNIDPYSSLKQYLVFAASIMAGQKQVSDKESAGEADGKKEGAYATSPGEVGGRFLRSKLAPVPAQLWTWGVPDKRGEKTDYLGRPANVPDTLRNLLIPMGINEVIKGFQEMGIAPAEANRLMIGLAVIGSAGASTFGLRTSYRNRNVEQEQRAREKKERDDLKPSTSRPSKYPPRPPRPPRGPR